MVAIETTEQLDAYTIIHRGSTDTRMSHYSALDQHKTYISILFQTLFEDKQQPRSQIAQLYVGATSAWSPWSPLAQLRWANASMVAVVAVCTTTLAQRRHGRRWQNYVGATSFSHQKIWLGQRLFANHVPTMSAMFEKIRSENTFSLIFGRGTCFPGVNTKLVMNLVLNLRVPLT